MPLLEVRNVAKRYGPVVALKSAELVVEPGEIHALLGANGAGKSTLVKILTGVIRHDSGTIAVNGDQVRIGSPEGARKVGFAPVFQDPAMLADLTVTQNLRLTRTDIGATREWLERMELRVDLTEMAGEILGVAALEGRGQDLLFDALAGQRRPPSGEMIVDGRPHTPRTPYEAIRSGVVLVPADRMLALLPQRPVRENIAAPLFNRISKWGPINRADENRRVQNAIERLSIDTRAQRQARRLSGGNQQKLTLARWLAAGFTTMLCFDPTRGIDVGTKRQIYALLRELAEAGAAVLLFTSELPEIQLVCDRTIVVYRGAVTAEMPASDADEAALLKAAHGLGKVEAAA